MKHTALKRKTPLRRMSKRRQGDYKEYMRKRENFLFMHPICQLWLHENHWWENGDGTYINLSDPFDDIRYLCNELIEVAQAPRSTEVHHVNGRNGSNYLDTGTWMAVCRESHERIEQNKSWARANGYLGKK